jgi:hypothetical protein
MQLPTDYLNQIAPQAPKKQLLKLGIKQVVVVGIALIVLVSVLAGVANSIAASKTAPLEHLAARLNATQTIVTGAQQNLKSSDLRGLNSNLSLYMTNTNRDIAAPLLSAGVDVTKLDANIVAAESTTALAARLEDARLNAVYDSHYATEMTYQLSTLLTLMSQIYNSTSNAQLKAFLTSAYNNLKPTEQSFSQFSQTTTDDQ